MKGRDMLRLMLVLAGAAFAGPDLYAPFAIDVLDSSGILFDKIEIATLVRNKGDASTSAKSFSASVVSVGVDSVHLKDHTITTNYTIPAGGFVIFADTTYVLKGAFSINTQVDPLNFLGEGGGQTLNNVRSQAFNFHPKSTTVRDTVVVYDTLRIHDTLQVVQKDTVKITLTDTLRISIRDTIFQKDTIRVTVRDTVVKKDTVKYCPPTLARAAKITAPSLVASVVYNAVGVKVWEGVLPLGGFPPAGLKSGAHLIVQGSQARRFRVAYK